MLPGPRAGSPKRSRAASAAGTAAGDQRHLERHRRLHHSGELQPDPSQRHRRPDVEKRVDRRHRRIRRDRMALGQSRRCRDDQLMSFGSIGAASDLGWRPNRKPRVPLPAPTAEFDFISSETLDPRITTSGGTNGTRVNSAGVIVAASTPRFDFDPATLAAKGLLIEEARTGYALRNAEFDNTKWTKSGASVTANVVNSPAGTLTADKQVEDTSNAVHALYQDCATSPSVTNTLSVYLKAGERTQAALEINDGSTGGVLASFDLAAGTLKNVSNWGVGTGASGTITPAGNGFYRCAVSGIAAPTGANTRANLYPVVSGSSTYPGDGVSGFYAWGAQLEAGLSA